MEQYLGFTNDPAILAIVERLAYTEDHELLSNRKDGGIHRCRVWPLGHFWDDDGEFDEPIFSRVDIAYGRYLSDGCTFLVWEDENARAGTLADADWLRRAVNEETQRTKRRAENRAARERYEAQQKNRGVPSGGVDFAAQLPRSTL